jgi:hypothetical protein
MGLLDLFTGTKRPSAGTPVLSRQEVRDRLLALNRQTAPWRVVDGAADSVDLVAEWSLEQKAYENAFRQAGKTSTFRIFMKLDEAAHEVRAVDREYTVSWSVDGAKLSLAASGFRGQKQSVSFGGPVHFTEQLPSGERVEYRFATSEIKKPIQEAVTAAGWVYKGVAFGKL